MTLKCDYQACVHPAKHWALHQRCYTCDYHLRKFEPSKPVREALAVDPEPRVPGKIEQ